MAMPDVFTRSDIEPSAPGFGQRDLPASLIVGAESGAAIWSHVCPLVAGPNIRRRGPSRSARRPTPSADVTRQELNSRGGAGDLREGHRRAGCAAAGPDAGGADELGIRQAPPVQASDVGGVCRSVFLCFFARAPRRRWCPCGGTSLRLGRGGARGRRMPRGVLGTGMTTLPLFGAVV
jgi:hypothetical protein